MILEVLFSLLVSISNEKPPQLPRSARRSATVPSARVSISNEKPPQLPHLLISWTSQMYKRFNLKREAAPVATAGHSCPESLRARICFNLKREAAPVATKSDFERKSIGLRVVSISNEKPPQLPQRLPRVASGAAGRLHLRGRWFWVL